MPVDVAVSMVKVWKKTKAKPNFSAKEVPSWRSKVRESEGKNGRNTL